VITLQDIICAVNIQHNCLDSQCTDIQQQPVHQERIETSRTKATVKHKSTPNFFLNVYSVHNYAHIQCVVPGTLRETPLRVTNAAEVRTMAIRQLRDKRAAKKGGDTSQLAGSGEGMDAQPSLAPHSAFDHAPAKPRKSAPKAKAKLAKASASGSSVQGTRKTAPTQQNSEASMQHQIVFAPPMGPPQHVYSHAVGNIASTY